ncbi:MAG TPA: cytochrome c-type biogenesis protein [Candidatus Manganitrophaceae bacterium]|nr:cytochrome c-type biogenesis protein [Candidatus Manganitrophaceae bacterium]
MTIFPSTALSRLFLAATLSALLALFSGAPAQTADPAPNPASLGEEVVQARVREVAKTLRCAVCQSESLWDSNATLAVQMREIIRERVVQGESPDEIRAYFVSRYGDFILLKPRNRLLWVGPFFLLFVGAVSLYIALRRWVARTARGGSEALPPLDERSRRRIEEELRVHEK